MQYPFLNEFMGWRLTDREYVRRIIDEVLAQTDPLDRDGYLDEVVNRLLMEWQLEDALYAASHMEVWLVEKTERLLMISEKMHELGLGVEAIQLGLEAVKVARSEEISWKRADALHAIAKVLHSFGEVRRADVLISGAIEAARRGEATENQQDSIDCSKALASICDTFAVWRRWSEARELANNIRCEPKRWRAAGRVEKIYEYATKGLPRPNEKSDEQRD